MMLAGLVTLIVFAWPGDALAWGPITHLVHGSNVLADLAVLTSPLRDLLATHRLPYLYGCIAADIFHAKKYTRSLYTHCHCWPVGWQIVEAANGEREEAFAYGYLSHLAADVYSHNHFVPVQLVTSFEARTLRHIYWEARFDAAQERDRWRLVRTVLRHRYRDLDRLVERVVERTLFLVQDEQAHLRLGDGAAAARAVAGDGEGPRGASRYPPPQADVDRFNGLCVSAIQDLMLHGQESACQHADPTGRETIAQANLLRRKLRALKRKGEVPEAIVAEIRALAHSAA
jgi:hypothetical protein